MTLERSAAEWLDQQRPRLRPTTHSLYGSYLAQHINPRLGEPTLCSLTVDDVAALIADMTHGFRYRERDGQLTRVEGKPFAAWTIRGVLVVLGRVIGRAVHIGLIGDNPIRLLEKEERPKIARRPFPTLSHYAIATLIGHTPTQHRTLIALSVLTGIRKGEALGLRWQDIDIPDGRLAWFRKSGRTRRRDRSTAS